MTLFDVARQFFRLLANDRRRVIGAWRAVIVLRRAMRDRPRALPTISASERLLRRLEIAGDLVEIPHVRGVFRVDFPYAQFLPLSDEQVIQEANPWAVFSHLTALVMHDLTDEIPSRVYATHFLGGHEKRVPLGTTPDDWLDLELPTARKPEQVDKTHVEWLESKPAFDFGTAIAYSQGLPIYLTDLERTLLDCLRMPERAGGVIHTFRAWHRARDRLDLAQLTRHVEQFPKNAVMKQRVGYLLERLQLSHPRVDEWRQHAQRGGSSKMVADAPFSQKVSEPWCLSLNVPDAALAELDE